MPLRVSLVTLLLVLAAAAPASATYPGKNGRLALTFQPLDNSGRALYTMQPDGGDLQRLTSPGRGVFSPSWSADGSRIVFTDNGGLYVVNADGSGETRLTNDARATHPGLSPDGRTIAFVREGSVYTMDVDGTDLRSFGRGSAFSSPRFSPDGNSLVFSREGRGEPNANGYRPQTFSIVTVGVDGSGERVLTSGTPQAHEPSFSPDGRKIVYSTDDAVHVIGSDGSGGSALPDSGGEMWNSGPVFSPDGTQIAYWGAGRPHGSGIYFVNADGSSPRVVDLHAYGDVVDLDWQPIPAPASEPPGPPCALAQFGTAARDVLVGTDSGDLLRGRAGNDRLSGGGGADCLFGGRGDDRLSGGAGNDRLEGFRGRDTLTGGSGRDRFEAGTGNDRVRADDGQRDKIDCGRGRDSAVVDEVDRVSRCERVRVVR